MSAAFIVMNKCILKHNTVKTIPPPFVCQIQSSEISDLSPLISFWPSRLPRELQRWRGLAGASTAPSSCRGALPGTCVPDPEPCQTQNGTVLPAVGPGKGRRVGGDERHDRAMVKPAELRRGTHLENWSISVQFKPPGNFVWQARITRSSDVWGWNQLV